MDFDFEPCSVCSVGDGLYCCKICNLKYCSEHLCLHLNVAWETNTWTSRNLGDDVNEEKSPSNIYGCNKTPSVETIQSGLGGNDPSSYNTNIQTNAKTILSYTQAQLEASLEFYNAQARRIRRELERRSLSLGNLSQSEQKLTLHSYAPSYKSTARKSKKLSKKQQIALDYLSNRVRSGALSIEQLKQILQSK